MSFRLYGVRITRTGSGVSVSGRQMSANSRTPSRIGIGTLRSTRISRWRSSVSSIMRLASRTRDERAHVMSASRPDEQRDLDRIRRICLAFPRADEAVLQDRPLFVVGWRRFALCHGESSPPRMRWEGSGRSLHFLSDPSERDALAQDPRFTSSPHHGDRGWMALRLDRGEVDWTEVAELLESAYRQVAG